MLSYQHAYHAGGPADVHKHALLLLALAHLARKAKPFVAIDVHAGEGAYALTRPEAEKTAEFRRGITRLWPPAKNAGTLAPYLDVVSAANPGGTLSVYPGSPAFVRACLREQDRLILNELHPGAAAALRRWVGNDPRIAVHKRDADEAIRALLPPEIRRGLVLIDPSYEMRGAYEETAAAVAAAVAKWPEGIFMVWYPHLADKRHVPLVEGLRKIETPMVMSELDLDSGGLADAPEKGLRGSGVIVVNPPWQFADDADALGKELAKRLGEGPRAKHSLTWLRPES